MHRPAQFGGATEAQATAMVQWVEEEAKSECRSVMDRIGVPALPRRESVLTCFRCNGASRCDFQLALRVDLPVRVGLSPEGSLTGDRHGNAQGR
jgi:hypothetical protein